MASTQKYETRKVWAKLMKNYIHDRKCPLSAQAKTVMQAIYNHAKTQ